MPDSVHTPVAFQFTEEMRGYVSPGQHTCQQGHDEGEAAGLDLMFHLTIRMEDLDAFISDPAHAAQAIGYLEGRSIGGRQPVLAGEFNLFTDSGDADRKTMLYRLKFEDHQGQPLTLSGRKDIRNDFGFDAWSDTTTLMVNIYPGHLSAAEEGAASLVASGVLHIRVRDFLQQLTTFQADAPTPLDRLDAIQRFGRLFLGKLWETHGLPRRHGREPRIRTIPLHSLEGVKDAEISTHYASTGDGLGISLLRFQRAPCKDVVLLVPGLTASSDMFIMPEHRNLTQVLLDEGFTDVWTLDGRISKRQPYNHTRHRFTVDDVALYDNPAALAAVRKAVGPEARIHIISHCLGAMSVAMSLFGKQLPGVSSVIVNGVALTPKVGAFAKAKLALGPFLAESILGVDYLNPEWGTQAGLSPGKLLAKGVSLMHRECDVPECHMTSFMWGYGYPVLFRHENLHEVTHRRTGDLFGGSGVHYYRHIRMMVGADNTAVKFDPKDVRYRDLPDNYLHNAADISTPVLLVAGQENALFLDSNVLCHERLEQLTPGRHQLEVIPGYGHADVIIGKNAAHDVFPRFIKFLRQHAR
jgi:cholesterol oxidase